MTEHMPTNESRKPVKDQIKDETKRAIAKKLLDKGQTVPADEAEWRDACAYIGNQMLSEEEFKAARGYIARNWSGISRQQVAGGKSCLAVFPCSDMGHKWTGEELKKKLYLRLLNVSKTDGLTRYFSFNPARYFELLPELMQKDVA